MRRTVWGCALASAICLGACDPFSFGAYSSTGTPVTSIQTPQFHPDTTFGHVIAGLHHSTLGDWMVVSAGLGTTVTAMPLFESGAFVPRSDPRFVCGGTVTCGNARAGVGLAGVATWGGARLCAMTGAYSAAGATPTMHTVHVRCLGESPPREFDILPPRGLEEAGFGLALAAPRPRTDTESDVGEVVIVGAPAGQGHVLMAEPSRVSDVTPGRVPPEAHLGDAVAVGHIRVQGSTARDLLIVAGAPGARAVFVVRGDYRSGRAMITAGCIPRSDEPGFGGAVAVGDVDADGNDDIIVGARLDAANRLSRVHVFTTNALPTSNVCDPSLWREAASIDCGAVSGRGAGCAPGQDGFGSSLAAGDLDGDGRDEIAIGAPGATVNGTAGAGAIWLVRATGSAGSLRLAAEDVLYDDVPNPQGQLGSTVLVDRIRGRDEVLATSPGVNEVMLFWCSGLTGDRRVAGTDTRCRPTR